MKKVLISAYLNNNLGDDLFVKILCERYPQTQFYIYENKAKLRAFTDINNLHVIYPNPLFKLIDKIPHKLFSKSFVRTVIGIFMDAHVCIGGSLFIENNNWKTKIKRDKGKLINNKPNFLLGCNFGPYKKTQFYESYQNIFSKYDDVCFRDMQSYELFKELPSVRLAQDVVFNLDYQGEETSEKTVGISLIDVSNRDNLAPYKAAYLQKMKQVCEYYINKNYQVALFSFCKYEGDETAIAELLQLLDTKYKPKVKVVPYEDNLASALAELNKVEIMYATRFHSMILGFLFNKKVFPIIYSKKMTNVLHDINFQGNYCEIKDIDRLEIEELDQLDYKELDMQHIIKDSNQQFRQLDKYLVNDWN
ncbi:polysaccharide pyruvyl transferase family protein [Niallia circulans]|uniref:polysaccharide pyruvyl transferase family protein n=1 Tax=Niallia circulans TaxID=1397 RepID=UPI00163B038A|nr:polysaccharide pyruvyl transferase family protein [Niallia circulans]